MIFQHEALIKIIDHIADMQLTAEQFRREGRTIAFVPTMGFLHEGHLSLMEKGRQLAEKLVISIFVNPTQFGPGEDFDSYPRDMQRDMAIAEKAGADIIFTPDKSALYPENFETYIVQTDLPEHLCGLSRPGHFKGVMTIVAKLFNIVKPHYAVFGEKDFQQLAIIRRMTTDLNFDTRIISCPTYREQDGLAMSSRNKYLTPDQRLSALSLSRALATAQDMVSRGESRAENVVAEVAGIISAAPETAIDYVKICDPETLEDVAAIDRPVLMALAVRVGTTRLIDNRILKP